MRNKFDEQLRQLSEELMIMADMIEGAIQKAVKAFLNQDAEAARVIMNGDALVDQEQKKIENICFQLLIQQQPVARDLRMITAAMKMVTDSVDAYVKHDIILAEKVVADDDVVDGYFDQVKTGLIEKIAADPGDGEYALDLLMIAKYFERIGDHAVNIAEWVIFSVTGAHKVG